MRFIVTSLSDTYVVYKEKGDVAMEQSIVEWDMRHIEARKIREVIVYYNFIERVCIFYLLIKINCLTWRGSSLRVFMAFESVDF